jgi:hypothetical protein
MRITGYLVAALLGIWGGWLLFAPTAENATPRGRYAPSGIPAGAALDSAPCPGTDLAATGAVKLCTGQPHRPGNL